MWGALAAESADIEALVAFPDLRRAYDEGLIDSRVIGRSELDKVEASPRGDGFERMKDRQPPIDDVAEATSWWTCFETPTSRRAEQLAIAAAGEFADDGPTKPYRAPQKVGRNEPCPVAAEKSTRSAAEYEPVPTFFRTSSSLFGLLRARAGQDVPQSVVAFWQAYWYMWSWLDLKLHILSASDSYDLEERRPSRGRSTR